MKFNGSALAVRYPDFLRRRVFEIQKSLCAVLSQIASGKACAHDKRTKREKERPERAVSPQPRATPWVSAYKRLRPVRAKVWANDWLLLLPLQGVGNGDMVPRALPWASYVTHQILRVLFALIYVIIKLHRSEEPIRNSHHKFYSLVPLQPRFLVICSWYC